jgi:HAD superfamily hydrolase (TIGR01509 family)
LARWPRAAVFDCDGLLVDSGACWEDAYAEVAGTRGRSLADVELSALAGASIGRAARQLTRDLGSVVDPQELHRVLRARFAAAPPPLLPGAGALVEGLAAHIPTAVASNAPLDVVVGVLERLGLRDRFRAVVSAEDAAADKPAPDVYLEACRRVGVCPSDAVAFEDSPVGARAARAAGLVVIAVPSTAAMRMDADLTVGRLDDPRLLEYLGLDRVTSARAV